MDKAQKFIEDLLEEKESSIKDFCEECKSDKFVCDRNYIICSDCGCLIDETISDAPEITRGVDDLADNRYSAPIDELIPQSSLRVKIVGPTNRANFFIKMFNTWNSVTYDERTLIKTRTDLTDKFYGKLNKSVINEAMEIYKIVRGIGEIKRGDARIGLIAACLYHSCHNNKITVTLSELSKEFGIGKTSISNGYNYINDLLMRTESKVLDNRINNRPLEISDYIKNFLDKFELEKDKKLIIRNAIEYIKDTPEVKRNKPPSIISSCIYIISQKYSYGLKIKDISRLCDVSESTITKYNKILTPLLKDFF